jgi:hypothetical protein
MGGAEGPADVAIVGDEANVRRQVRELGEMGVTDFNGTPFNVREDPDATARTQALLGALARGE